jgi:hypothetical protein
MPGLDPGIHLDRGIKPGDGEEKFGHQIGIRMMS